MTNKQSEALRIADLLGKEIHRTVYVDVLHQNAINELRRLHEVNAELVKALKAMQSYAAEEGKGLRICDEALAKAQGEEHMTDRELLQMALDALRHLCLYTRAIKGYDGEQVQTAIDALKARLAQPENKFNPDWDAMAVMVEEQQRMAKRIEGLEAQLAQPEPAECDGGQCGIGGYCKQCPKTKSDVPETAFGEIKPVLYQVRGRPNWDTAPKWGEWKFCTEPVANDYIKTPVLHDWEYQVRSLYTTPPQREWVGLTDEEVEDIAHDVGYGYINVSSAIEQALKEKNNG